MLGNASVSYAVCACPSDQTDTVFAASVKHSFIFS